MSFDVTELYRLAVLDLHTIAIAVGFQPTDEGVTPAAILERVQALVEERDAARAEQGEAGNVLAMLDHLIAHVEDHGEDAASDSVYEDLLAIRAAMLAADKATT